MIVVVRHIGDKKMKINCPVCNSKLTIPDIQICAAYVKRTCRKCKSVWDIGIPPKCQKDTNIIMIDPYPSERIGLETPSKEENEN